MLMTRSSQPLLTLLLFVCSLASVQAQSIFTVAGGGTDEGRPATASAVTTASIAVAPSGEIYYLPTSDNRIRVITRAGLVAHVAGDGAAAFGGDDGPAAASKLSFPDGLAVDREGNVFISDRHNNRVRRIDRRTGIITTFAGGAPTIDDVWRVKEGVPATEERLSSPQGLAFDPSGNLLIGEPCRIRRVTTDGKIDIVAGPVERPCSSTFEFSGDGGPARAARLSVPEKIISDREGNIFFSDSFNHRVRRIDAVSKIITTVAGNGTRGFSGDNGPATEALLAFPRGLAFDAAGNLLIADRVNSRIRRVLKSSGTIDTIAGTGGPHPVSGAVFAQDLAAAGEKVIVGGGDGIIELPAGLAGAPRRIAGNGQAAFTGDGGAAIAAAIPSPVGVTIDRDGNIFVGDAGRVRRIDRITGSITTVAQGFMIPQPVWGGGDLYLMENSAIYRLGQTDGSGTRGGTRIAGSSTQGYGGDGGAATEAMLNAPRQFVVDDAKNIFIADSLNHRIRRVDGTTGMISTIAGTGTPAFSGDGGPATAAELKMPSGVAIDTAGNVLISDTGNGRIRIVGADGKISTIAGIGVVNGVQFQDDIPATSAKLVNPSQLATDGGGSIFVVSDLRIRRIGTDGRISTYAGSGVSGFGGDGGPAVSAGLSVDLTLATSADSDLFIADRRNNRVRAVPACRAMNTPALLQPSDGSSSVSQSARLSWSAQRQVFTYDVYLDTVDPPRAIVASDVRSASYSPANLQPLTKYYWKVVAKGDPFCTPFSTASSDVYSFTTTGICDAPGAFDATATQKANGLTIQWTDAARAATYDVYAGTANPPRLVARGLTSTSFDVDSVAPGTTYWWRVVAHAACDPTRTSEAAIRSMTTAGGCATPGMVMLASPSDAAGDVNATAVLRWNATPNAGAYDLYFGSGSTPALYMADVVGTSVTVPKLTPGTEYSWRVVAKAACDPSRSATSAMQRFTVSSGCAAPDAPAISAPSSAAAAGATYAITWSESAGMDDAGSYLVERSRDANFASMVDRQETTSTSASFVALNEGTYYHRVIAIAGCNRSRRSSASSAAEVAVAANANVVVFTVEPKGVITKLGDKLEDVKTSFTLENLGNAPVQVLVAPQLLGSVPFFRIVDPFGGDGVFVTLDPRKPKTLDVQFSGPPNDVAGTYQGIIYVTSTGEPLAFTPQAFVNLKVGGSASAVAPKFLVGGVEGNVIYFPPASGDDAARPALTFDIINSGDTAMDVVGEIGPEQWLKLEKDWNATPIPPRSFRPVRLFTQRTRAISGSALPRSTYFTVRNVNGQSARLLVQDTGGAVQWQGRGTLLAPGERSLIAPLVNRYTTLHVTNTSAAAVPVELIFTPNGVDGVDDQGVVRAALLVPANDVLSMVDVVAQAFGLIGEPSGWIEVRAAQETIGQLVVRAASREGTTLPVAMRGEGARLDSVHHLTGIDRTVVLIETSGREKTSVKLTLFDASGTKKSEQTVDVPRYGTKRLDNLDGVTAEIVPMDGGGAVIALAVETTSIVASQPQERAITLSSLGRQTNATAKQIYAIPSASSGTTVRLHATQTANVKINGETLTINAGQTASHQATGALTIDSDTPLTIAAGTHPVITLASEALTGAGSSKPLIADGFEHLPGVGSTGLVLTEHAGRPATVTVTLYEAGHRSRPIAEKDVVISAKGQVRLESLFASLGLETDTDTLDQRRKPRANVAVVVVPKSGEGLVSAVTISGNNAALLVPAGDMPLTVPQSRAATGSVTRRRAAGR